MREDFANEDPFCWWSSLEDRSRPDVDLDAAGAGSDFAADLIALASELRRHLETDDSALGELAADLSEGLPGSLRTQRVLDRLLDTAGQSAGELIDRALVLALGELEGDGR